MRANIWYQTGGELFRNIQSDIFGREIQISRHKKIGGRMKELASVKLTRKGLGVWKRKNTWKNWGILFQNIELLFSVGENTFGRNFERIQSLGHWGWKILEN